MQAVELWPARDHCGPSGTPADKRLWQRAAVMHPTARWVEPLRMGAGLRGQSAIRAPHVLPVL